MYVAKKDRFIDWTVLKKKTVGRTSSVHLIAFLATLASTRYIRRCKLFACYFGISPRYEATWKPSLCIQEQVHHRKHFGYVDTLKKHINIQSIDSSDKENVCVYCEPSTLLERHISLLIMFERNEFIYHAKAMHYSVCKLFSSYVSEFQPILPLNSNSDTMCKMEPSQGRLSSLKCLKCNRQSKSLTASLL